MLLPCSARGWSWNSQAGQGGLVERHLYGVHRLTQCVYMIVRWLKIGQGERVYSVRHPVVPVHYRSGLETFDQ